MIDNLFENPLYFVLIASSVLSIIYGFKKIKFKIDGRRIKPRSDREVYCSKCCFSDYELKYCCYPSNLKTIKSPLYSYREHIKKCSELNIDNKCKNYLRMIMGIRFTG